jgi:hypothetical protein
MASIPNNNLLLKEITMPGSHDAGVSRVHGSNKLAGWVVGKSGYVCQEYDIAGQLNAGSRFFDVRFSMKSGVPTTVHATAGSGGWGESAESIFKAIKAHLDTNDQEIVIVRVSHTDATAGAAVYREQLKHLGARAHACPPQTNLAMQKLEDLRGKVIVAYASDAIASPRSSDGQIRFGKASKESRLGIVTCGEYANSNDMALINYKQLKRTNEHREGKCNDHSGDDHLFMLYWQMTGGDVGTNTTKGGDLPDDPGSLVKANGTHYNLPFLLKWLNGDVAGSATHGHTFSSNSTQSYPKPDVNRCEWVPNVINLDFVNAEVCSRIIAFNEAKLRAAGKWDADA